MPRASVRAITAALQSGETTNVPPASATASASLAVSTVPAPMVAHPCNALLAAPIDRIGSGELSGTSIMVMPALTQGFADGDGLLGRDAAQYGDEMSLLGHSSSAPSQPIASLAPP